MHPTLKGIWPAILIQNRQDHRIDFEAVRAATRHYAEAGVHGVYTADTASEFYTLEYEEWNELATDFRATTRELNIPAGIGCTWTNQAGVLRRIDRAVELGYHNIHLSQPYWIKLNEPAQRAFWQAVSDHVGNSLGIVIYAGSEGQFAIDGDTVRRLREICPAIAGTKTTGFAALSLNSLLALCPDLSHFVHEQVLVSSVALGAAGNFSSLAGLSASFMVRWFSLLEEKNWERAFEIQRRVNRFYEEAVTPARRQGYLVDKALAELGRCPGVTSRAPRPPYQALPDDLAALLQRTARACLPECFPA